MMVNFNKKAFTLVELLVVIAVMATLMAILLPNFMGSRERAMDTKKKEDMVAIKNALRMYYNDHQSYPATNSIGLPTYLSTYMPGISGVGYTYEYVQTSNGDGFNLRFKTDATNEIENTESKQRCGVTNSDTGYYYVCAN